MAIQHKDIPELQLHEPKGASTAAIQTTYISNGAGSGTWRKVAPTDLEGQTVNLNVDNQKLLTDGVGSITSRVDSAYGSMTISDNTTSFAVTAAVDPTLSDNTDYVIFTGTGAPWVSENLFHTSFNTNKLVVETKGVYRLDVWSNISGFPSNTAKVGMKWLLNGITYSSRKVIVKSNSGGDYGSLGGYGLVSMNAGDFIQIVLASSVTGNVIFDNFNATLTLVRATI